MNDFWNNVPIGTLSSIYTGELDKTTLIGALETIFRYAIENFSGKPICYVITHNPISEKNANGNTLKEFRDAIISVCEKYCIPYFDGYTKCGLNVWNTSQKDLYCPDRVHPNTEGYKRYYTPQILAMFKEIMFNN